MVNHPNRSRRGFIRGQFILWQNDLREAWEFDCYFAEHLMVRARRGNAVLSAPIEAWIPAPVDWADAPSRPQLLDGRYDLGEFSSLLDELAPEIVDWETRFALWERRHKNPLLKRLQEIGR